MSRPRNPWTSEILLLPRLVLAVVDIVTTNGDTRSYEAIDVSFPATYLQDQFDEVIVSDPITIRIPDGWGFFE